jgi:hypothetical protein
VTSLSPSENYAVADVIMSEVGDMLAQGARPEDVRRDIARAQVYATLASAATPPDEGAVSQAIRGALSARRVDLGFSDADAAARAVMGLL